MHPKLKLALFVFLIGFVGVLSTLTMEVPLPEVVQKAVAEVFSPWQFKLLMLINPTVFLVIGVVMGILLHDKVRFQLPLFEGLVYKDKKADLSGLPPYGIIGGLIAGVAIVAASTAFAPFLSEEFLELGRKFKPTLAARFLYGGLTEEILVRFGMMTLLVWLLFKVSGKLNALVYGIGIAVSALVFGLGHLPMVLSLVPEASTTLILYIILGNALGGIVFGWLYWKKGLETAMIAHMVAHIVLLIGEAALDL